MKEMGSMKYLYVVLLLAAMITLSCSNENGKEARLGTGQIVWNINNLAVIGGHEIAITGFPNFIDTPSGKAIVFDGEQDGLQVTDHPLSRAEKFTLEIIFCPYPDGPKEQCVLHLQEDGSENRLLVKTRLTDDNQWYLETFMSSADGNQTLSDSTQVHPLGEWFNGTLVFDGVEARLYVNGVLEFSAEIPDFTPYQEGLISIGVSKNKTYWFKGAIIKTCFTRSALSPEEFLKP
ncbi:LamG domain-containing protein [Candidatus Latescibacterota bacterium]